MRYQQNILCFIFFFISIYIKAQFIIPEKPKRIYPVNDYANILSHKQLIKLNRKLINYNKKKSIAIVISIIDSINGEDISMIAAKWGTIWQIGQKQESNGIFILLVKKDKKISIQTGYGIESYLTDIKCKKIINRIIPFLQQEKYYFTIDNIINSIFNNLKDYKTIYNKNTNFNISNKIFYLFILIILFIYFYLKKNFCIANYMIYPNIPNNDQNISYQDDNFDDFGEGGEFGGGGASGNW